MEKVLTDYQKAHRVRECMLYAMAAPLVYKSWSQETATRNAQDYLSHAAGTRVNINNLSVAELDSLGFGLWSSDTDDPACGLRVMPLWLYPYLETGQSVTFIDGVSTFVHDDYPDDNSPNYIDCDNRFGCVAFGVIPKASN
jgi:hypothetical protein